MLSPFSFFPTQDVDNQREKQDIPALHMADYTINTDAICLGEREYR